MSEFKQSKVSREELDAGGLGDLVAKVTKKLGIPTCDGCDRRRKALNKVPLPESIRRRVTRSES